MIVHANSVRIGALNGNRRWAIAKRLAKSPKRARNGARSDHAGILLNVKAPVRLRTLHSCQMSGALKIPMIAKTVVRDGKFQRSSSQASRRCIRSMGAYNG